VKVILETNVFVSGVFFSGAPYPILQAWQEAKIELVVSPDILDEYGRVGKILAEDHPAIDLMPVLGFVIQNATIYSALPPEDAHQIEPAQGIDVLAVDYGEFT
jgi:hypothetical protein